MTLFQTTDIEDDFARLDPVEARHAVQVLRKQLGDPIDFVDGLGTYYKGIIHETSKKKCVIQIKGRTPNFEVKPYRLHIAIAPTKVMDRIEWFVEKCTEIGIDEITLLLTHHSERRRAKEERLEKIAISAMKQSLKAFKPIIHPLTKVKAFLADQANIESAKFIAHCENLPKKVLVKTCPVGQPVTIMIGPEGDFSTSEIEAANTAGFESVSLGTARLRTETAGLVACHTVSMVNA